MFPNFCGNFLPLCNPICDIVTVLSWRKKKKKVTHSGILQLWGSNFYAQRIIYFCLVILRWNYLTFPPIPHYHNAIKPILITVISKSSKNCIKLNQTTQKNKTPGHTTVFFVQRIIFLVFLWWNVSITCFWRCVNKTCNPFYFWNVMYFTVKQYLMRKKVGQDLILPIKNGLDCVKYLHKSSLGEGLKMRSRWCHWKEKLFQM